MKVVWGVLLAVLLFAVPVQAQVITNAPHISVDRTTLVCDSGVVMLGGPVDATTGYTNVLINFGPSSGPTFPPVLQTSMSGVNKSWQVMVNVTQGQSYTIFARLYKSDWSAGVGRVFIYTVPACNATKIQELIDLAEDRLE